MTALPVSPDLTPDQAALEAWLAETIGESIHLCSTFPDSNTMAGHHFGTNAAKAAEWAVAENLRGKGVYWSVNRVREGVHKKPAKADLLEARFAHCDIDPPKDGSPWDKRGKVAQLEAYKFPPSFVIDSGNGLGAYWRFDEPMRNVDAIEGINNALIADFGAGPGTWNVDRLMRLPFTVNWPNKVKAAAGCVKVLSGVITPDDGTVHTPHAFSQKPPKKNDAPPSVDTGGQMLLTSADLKRGRPAKLRRMVDQPGEFFKDGDRSKWAFAIGCEMVRGGYNDADIIAILMNPANAGAAHVIDQPDRLRAAQRICANARAEVQSKVTAEGEVSEDQIALAFTKTHGSDMLFDHSAGKWFEWAGNVWRKNETKIAFHFARTLARSLSDGQAKFSKASVANGAEAFARADPTHAVTAEKWDGNPWLLGTPGGTVDLRTGDYFEARRDDYLTKQTGIAPAHGTPNRWLQFLNESTGNDAELVRFLQQMSGYCLSGITSEHALFFIYGDGGNGKSVFLNTLNKALGDYATTAAMTTFTAAKFDQHPTDLAMLKGARLVSASETEEGRAWAESRIKQLTGGDKISARFMRMDFFEYVPQFKLVIIGNHAPILQNVDEAARRRFRIIPFTRRPERPDRELENKLEAELPQILAWMIAGCKDWQANGLIVPESVRLATEDYFSEQDLFGQWIAEHLMVGDYEWETAAALYADWHTYADANGERVGSIKAFGSTMGKRGWKSKTMRAQGHPQKVYQGLKLKPKGGFDA